MISVAAMPTIDVRKHQLYRMSLEQLVAEYRRIRGIPQGMQPVEIAGTTIGQLIETILAAEFPESTREA
jgi:hypothetical protein